MSTSTDLTAAERKYLRALLDVDEGENAPRGVDTDALRDRLRG